MTSKEFVLKTYPSAKSEIKISVEGNKLWVIKIPSAVKWISTGKTENKAWISAKNLIKSGNNF